METFGFPPNFPEDVADVGSLTEEVNDPTNPGKKVKRVKSKVAAKSLSLKYQWLIMRSLGMEDSEIKKYVIVSMLPDNGMYL